MKECITLLHESRTLQSSLNFGSGLITFGSLWVVSNHLLLGPFWIGFKIWEPVKTSMKHYEFLLTEVLQYKLEAGCVKGMV